jgi:hypothetical protein
MTTAENGVSEQDALQTCMEEKAKEFLEKSAKVHTNA